MAFADEKSTDIRTSCPTLGVCVVELREKGGTLDVADVPILTTTSMNSIGGIPPFLIGVIWTSDS